MDRKYYAEKLSARRLDRVYEIAGPRVRQYLQAEIEHVRAFIQPGDRVLELGCGTGRVLAALNPAAGTAWGVDHAYESVRLARNRHPDSHWAVMDAAGLGLRDDRFDVVAGIQNFISACKVPPEILLRECLRVARPGARILLSSYAGAFWPHRLDWFRAQADEGLLGAIDEDATGDGVIVGKDGFRATTFTPENFADLAGGLGVEAEIYEIDRSSVFCKVTKR
jgi:2-polyprenyl-6-hydroxyphenyl methylase/3-demethylubiquinone-9 3-methyltransferase